MLNDDYDYINKDDRIYRFQSINNGQKIITNLLKLLRNIQYIR